VETNIARTFAALSATNEAILYAKSPEQLYRQVCEAAFSGGDFLATAVFLLETGPTSSDLPPGLAMTSSGCAKSIFRSQQTHLRVQASADRHFAINR
jgi:hypothetical protein